MHSCKTDGGGGREEGGWEGDEKEQKGNKQAELEDASQQAVITEFLIVIQIG